MKRPSFLLAFLFLSMLSQAQFISDEEPEYEEEQPKLTDRLIFGGNFGLMIGTSTYINLSPTVGYKVTPSFSAGGGIIFEYISDKRYKPRFETSVFGGKLFAQQELFDFLILYSEVNLVSLETKYYNWDLYPDQKRFWLPVPWVGGGYFQKAGKGGIYLMILFNLNNTNHSPYQPYELRAGFYF